MDPTEPASTFFAPELFQHEDDAPPTEETFDRKLHDEDTKMDDEPLFQTNGNVNGYDGANEDDFVKQETLDTSYPPLDGEAEPAGDSSLMDLVEDSFNAEDTPSKATPDKSQGPRQRKHPGKSRKADPDARSKSHVHSSKNEGQHTDRRYLCYLCNKLFTRRRSVRDHISKIHNTKTWEPLRSLEVVVDPISGEPIESLEDIVARGPPPPPPKPPKAEKAKKAAKAEEEDEEEHHDELQGEEDETREEEESAPTTTQPPVQSSPPPAATPVAALKKSRPLQARGRPLQNRSQLLRLWQARSGRLRTILRNLSQWQRERKARQRLRAHRIRSLNSAKVNRAHLHHDHLSVLLAPLRRTSSNCYLRSLRNKPLLLVYAHHLLPLHQEQHLGRSQLHPQRPTPPPVLTMMERYSVFVEKETITRG